MVAATSQAPVPGQFTPAALMQHLAVVAVVPGHPEFVCNNMKYKKIMSVQRCGANCFIIHRCAPPGCNALGTDKTVRAVALISLHHEQESIPAYG
jgi:hypothetical protein